MSDNNFVRQNCYIQIVNNQPVNHPALEENLLHAFGSIPPDWVPFNRVTKVQALGDNLLLHKKHVVEYLQDENGNWVDTWSQVDYTDEEWEKFVAHHESHLNNPHIKLDQKELLANNIIRFRPDPKTFPPAPGNNMIFVVEEKQWVEKPPTHNEKDLFHIRVNNSWGVIRLDANTANT